MQNYFSLHDTTEHSRTLCTDTLWCMAFQPAWPGTQSTRVSGHCFASRALGFAIHGRAKRFPGWTSCSVESSWALLHLSFQSDPGLFLSAFPGQG